jgi:hypothetical protein
MRVPQTSGESSGESPGGRSVTRPIIAKVNVVVFFFFLFPVLFSSLLSPPEVLIIKRAMHACMHTGRKNFEDRRLTSVLFKYLLCS